MDENKEIVKEENVTADTSIQEKNEGNKLVNALLSVGKTLWRWTKRMFMGASKELTDEEKFKVENLESPGKLAVKAFFTRKLAVVSLVVLVFMFLFAFIGPLFVPMDLTYTDNTQANIAPTTSLMAVPSKLKKQVKDINGHGSFTIGLSKDKNLYIWGVTKDNLTNIDYSVFPSDIKSGNVEYASAGTDHIMAITSDGKVVGWGNSSRGQYGASTELGVIPMPDELINGTVDVNKVSCLECGRQATALVVDGKLYIWGNSNNIVNLHDMNELQLDNVQKVVFSGFNLLALNRDGTLSDANKILSSVRIKTASGSKQLLTTYLSGKKVVDIGATDNCFALILESGEMLVFGAIEYGEDEIPALSSGEKWIKIVGGVKHFVGLTSSGKAYAWGMNTDKQANFSGVSADDIFTAAKQSYLVNNNGKLTKKYGRGAYIFGTDDKGRDLLTRIIHGGKMTLTIGAVAVIVSTIIAIIVGCISGYFGGWVDMLLMRVAEIVGAIPFLPFAMMLSHVLSYTTVSENMRIFIIMLILGVLSWTGLAHMIRGQVLAEREKEFVTAAKAMGVKESKIAFKHILPNIISIILVSVTLDFAGCLLTESSLSYLGFGVQQPRPTWGNMLNGAKNDTTIKNFWWQWVFPSIFLAIATICINIIGDTLRDVLDPKTSQDK